MSSERLATGRRKGLVVAAVTVGLGLIVWLISFIVWNALQDPADTSTPEGAVEVFVDAFADDDFVGVWGGLDDEAQFIFTQLFNLGDFDRLVDVSAIPNFQSEFMDVFSIGETEAPTPDSFAFEELMLIADPHDAFLIDLSSGSATPRHGTGDGDRMDLFADVDGIEGEVLFRLTQDGQGVWRINQVEVQDGDLDWIPWSIPSG